MPSVADKHHANGAAALAGLEQRRGEHIVDDQRRAGGVRDLRHFGDVDHVERRIGRTFQKKSLVLGRTALRQASRSQPSDQRGGAGRSAGR